MPRPSSTWFVLILLALVAGLLAALLAPATTGKPPVRRETGTQRDTQSILAANPPAAPTSSTLTVRISAIPPDPKLAWEMRIAGARNGERPDLLLERQGEGPREESIRLPAEFACLVEVKQPGMPVIRREVPPRDLGSDFVVEIELRAPWRLGGAIRTASEASVPGARVVIERTGSGGEVTAEATSDASGRFQLPNLESGTLYALRVTAPGFQLWRTRDLRGEPGEDRILNVVLEPAAKLRGRILDSAGEPVAGVDLTVQRVATETAALVPWEVEDQLSTDRNGVFECDGLRPGLKKVTGTPRYEIGATTLLQFLASLEAGRTTDVGDVVVGAGKVTLTFRYPEGGMPESVRVRFGLTPYQKDRRDVIVAYVWGGPTGGRIEGLPPGRLQLLVTDTTSGAPTRPATRAEFDYDGGEAQHEVVLEARPSTPDREAEVIALAPEKGAILLLTAGDRILSARVFGGPSVSPERVPPGVAGPVMATYIRGGRFGRRPVTPGQRLEIDADTPGGHLEVTVTDGGRPVHRAAVFLALSPVGSANSLLAGMTDVEGRLTVNGVPTDSPWYVSASGSDLETPFLRAVFEESVARVALDLRAR